MGLGTSLAYMTSTLYVVESSLKKFRGIVIISKLGNTLGTPILYILMMILRQEVIVVGATTLPIIQIIFCCYS